MRFHIRAAVMLGACLPTAAEAASFDGAHLSLVWTLPFIGLLLSIAVLPLLAPRFWHHHFGKLSAAWALAFLLPFAVQEGGGTTGHLVVHALLAEYFPFIILLLALFTVGGGIAVRGNLHGSPETNLVLIAIGTVLASLMGTTGASMVLIRPLIRANDGRRYNAHVVVFFIFLVSNIGGALTPLGDPPLFLGFLLGVDFFWPTVHLLPQTIFVAVLVLAVFYGLDRYFYAKEEDLPPRPDPTPDSRVRLEGGFNMLLLLGILGAVLLSGFWKPDIRFLVYGTAVELQNLARDVLLLGITFASWRFTREGLRKANDFTWGAIIEVAKLFAGIFITIIPAIAILRGGLDGALAPVVRLVSDDSGRPIEAAYFWLTGGLSSFLDNAPTYLVFFNAAGGDPQQLMGPLAATLAAISAGAVFMGANTYIGNAPNFMVKSIAEERGVKMPSFFGYMIWSGCILMPVFLLTTMVFYA